MCFPISLVAQLLFVAVSIAVFGCDAPKCSWKQGKAATRPDSCRVVQRCGCVCVFVCVFTRRRQLSAKKSHSFLLCVLFFFWLSVVICCLARSATTAALSRRLHFCVKNDLYISAQPFGSTLKVHVFFLSQSFPSTQLRKCSYWRTFQNILQFSASTSDPQSWGHGAALPAELTTQELDLLGL